MNQIKIRPSKNDDKEIDFSTGFILKKAFNHYNETNNN